MTAAPIQNSFIFLLYFLARAAGFPCLVLYFLYRGYLDRRFFQNLGERAGALPRSFKRTPPGSIWLHAVSLGEVISAIRLIDELRKSNPAIPVYLSTATLAGRAIAEQKVAKLVDGIFYAPIDYAFAVRGVLRTIRPAVVVTLETEIWPVLYREVKRAGCGLMVLNGRISDRAIPRYRLLKWFFAPVLQFPDALFVQTQTDLRRYLELGAPERKVRLFGNLKYDAAPTPGEPPRLILDLLDRMQPREIWIAASTMPGLDAADLDEDDAVIAAFRDLTATHPSLLLILVPRRPERFALAAEKLRGSGLHWVRRSEADAFSAPALPCVLLLDSIGELPTVFPLADVVFMGGTLARRGGHNVLEPAACAKAIVTGPHMENFSAIAADFREREAWLQIAGPGELAQAVHTLLTDRDRAAELGRRAAALAAMNTGIATRAALEILDAHDSAVPQWDWSGPTRPMRRLLAQLWKAGHRIKQKRDAAKVGSLGRAVISVGGLAMGGTGKTPFVEMLSRKLREQGYRPAILTRGYRRRSLDRMVLVEAGAAVPTSYTGDEAQIFVRSAQVDVGVGADRWSTGRLLEERFEPDVFLLDDGFQHGRLKRDLDIVLIDALDPFPGGGVFPVGTMREPLSGLARAGAFVITRTQTGREYKGIRRILNSVNPSAPVWLAGVEARGWIPVEPAHGPVAAFCGLGNPAAFWQTLREQGFDPVFTWTFSDHHHYRPHELRRLAYQAWSHGASALLTTEKDAMNLPENAGALVEPLVIHWLKIGTVVRGEAELLTLVKHAGRLEASI